MKWNDSASKFELNRKHAYCYQIQGTLFICKGQFCDFIVWTNNNLYIDRISFNENELHNEIMPKLKEFYFCQYLPYYLEIVNDYDDFSGISKDFYNNKIIKDLNENNKLIKFYEYRINQYCLIIWKSC